MRVVCIVLAIAILAPAIATAQSFVYVNNQDTLNSVSGFAVSTTGALTPVLGSPFLTGGVGSTTTCYGLDRMTISTVDKLLLVSNSSDQSVSVFQIDASSGALTATPGSPFASGLALDACGGISLAVTPDGKFLMASSNGQIQSFNIAVNGSLTPAALTANCCSPTVGMKISADGNLLALSNESSISVYTVNADGSLTVIPGSPFAKQGTGLISVARLTVSTPVKRRFLLHQSRMRGVCQALEFLLPLPEAPFSTLAGIPMWFCFLRTITCCSPATSSITKLPHSMLPPLGLFRESAHSAVRLPSTFPRDSPLTQVVSSFLLPMIRSALPH
jgi:hypothetical protein